MAVDKKLIEMAAGAMLHDIGKVLQRQGIPLGQDTEHLYRYRHSCYTAEFFKQISSICKDLDWANVSNLASYHHNPNTWQQKIIQEADIYSAASERVDNEKALEIDRGIQKRPLVSVFSTIKIDTNNPIISKWGYPVGKWKANKDIFPKDVSSNVVNSSQYKDLCGHLMKEFDKLSNIPLNLVIDSLISICREYMSLIPSSAQPDETPDIPLFDHCYTTAAISCAMYQWHLQSGDEKSVSNRNISKILLVSGDLSGIQDFILDLPNEAKPGIAKKLRARSFYVSLLSTASCRFLLDELGLPSCNCIMDAGGKFIILAQNTSNAISTINNVKLQIDKWMLRTFGGKISINISDPVPMSGNDLKDGNYQICYEKLNQNTDKSKKNKFGSVLINNGRWDNSSLILKYDNDSMNAIDEQMKQLGEKLPKLDQNGYILLRRSSSQSGILSLFDCISLELATQKPHLDETILASLSVNPKEIIPGFGSVYIALHTPRLSERIETDEGAFEKGQIKPFNKIAESAEGVKKLAVLKADVDKLGRLFSEGVGTGKHYSISRIAAFSRQLNSFFTEYLEYLMTEEYQDIYTEYAGGDDLLLVGPWDKVVEFASRLNGDFHSFTCKNSDINISAAIVLSDSSTPISNAVRQSDELLELAKTSGRNRIGFLGIALDWDSFDGAIKDSNSLDEMIEKGQISQSLLYRLLRYYQMYERTQKGRFHITDALWRSHLRYDLARNISKEDQIARDRIESIVMDKKMNRLKVSSTIALYKNRK